MTAQMPFTFNISLSILNHLGRNLYRNLSTILGEAISNSWDADANNVFIVIDKKNGRFEITDDGVGMSQDDFQDKFLKIGYSKRKDGKTKTIKQRPFIGRKGIGKLALLSCAEKVIIITKTEDSTVTGGVINNSQLTAAIKDDVNSDAYKLDKLDFSKIDTIFEGSQHGTKIIFENINESIKNSVDHMKTVVALYFRFSLIDSKFNIYINGDLITTKNLKTLVNDSQFCWKINNNDDDFITSISSSENCLQTKKLDFQPNVKGFIASVIKPRDTKIEGTDERVTIDLFVNGRMREKDILKHIPSARIVENYLYGQIHYDDLDEGIDRFTSSREGVLSDDKEYRIFLDNFKEKILSTVVREWDELRIKNRLAGDPEGKAIPKVERKARELFNEVAKDYAQDKKTDSAETVNGWIASLEGDAQFNIGSYTECFISENLIRQFIKHDKRVIPESIETKIVEFRNKEQKNKLSGNLNIEIRRNSTGLSYLDMDQLSRLVEKNSDQTLASLPRDSAEYKPIRDAMAHTSLLTLDAKEKLTSVYKNIKARIKILLLEV